MDTLSAMHDQNGMTDRWHMTIEALTALHDQNSMTGRQRMTIDRGTGCNTRPEQHDWTLTHPPSGKIDTRYYSTS